VIVTPILVRGTKRTALSGPTGSEMPDLPALAANNADSSDTLAAAGQDFGFIIE
jgi:hypothetical protein